MKIGMIGLGLMGMPMLRNLQCAGFTLSVWARQSQQANAAAALGATVMPSAAALVDGLDVVITMISDGAALAEVCFARAGLAEGLARRSAAEPLVVIDMSTIAPQQARDIGLRWQTLGVDFIDAPVSGGESGAIAATLTIMLGGGEAVCQRMMPIFNVLGERITYGAVVDKQFC